MGGKASNSEYVRQRIAAITDQEKSGVRSKKIKSARLVEGRDSELDRLISESTGPNGELYGHKD